MADPLARIRELQAEREPVYRRAGSVNLTDGRPLGDLVPHVLRTYQQEAHEFAVSQRRMAPDREVVRARLRALGFDEVRFARVGGTDAARRRCWPGSTPAGTPTWRGWSAPPTSAPTPGASCPARAR